ncbi:hypothetical protein LOCC1_G002095 [Lachnellula occidentalis]|uniref:CFEM domain-containing protein n=1 Tax=Lachnellula occidentalis TaxID=215460 RepID=A0A8H8UJM2_9HELO|nr:hypothetical protein LOCC1_G002095 [Lachnellula occidentalis]
MRFTTLAIPLGLKACTTQFTTGTTIGGCAALDIPCICASSGFLNSVSLAHNLAKCKMLNLVLYQIACCLAGSCNSQDQATAVAFAQNLCKTSGAANIPSAVVCSTSKLTSTSSSASSSANSAASSAVASTTTTATATAKGNSGVHNLAGIGAGMVGALAAVVLV